MSMLALESQRSATRYLEEEFAHPPISWVIVYADGRVRLYFASSEIAERVAQRVEGLQQNEQDILAPEDVLDDIVEETIRACQELGFHNQRLEMHADEVTRRISRMFRHAGFTLREPDDD